MRSLPVLLVSLLLLVGVAAGCGDEDAGGDSADASGSNPEQVTTAPKESSPEDVGAGQGEQTSVNVLGQETVLDLSDAASGELEQQGVTLEALAPARSNDNELVLPITGGRVDLDDVAGTVDHAGGFAFVAGDKRVDVRDPFLDTRTGTLYGSVDGSRVRMFTIDMSSVDVRKREDHLVGAGMEVSLAEDGAAVLNEELGRGMSADQQIGTLRVRLVPLMTDAAGAPDEPGQGIEYETEDLEEQVRDLADRALEDLTPEDRERLEEAADDLQRALEGR